MTVMTGASVERIDRVSGRLEATITGGRAVRADLVVVGAGVRPEVDWLDRLMSRSGRPGDPRSPGRCRPTSRTSMPRATASKRGTRSSSARHTCRSAPRRTSRVASPARTPPVRTRSFAGSVGTQVVKVFDLAAARTGLTVSEASAAGFDARSRSRPSCPTTSRTTRAHATSTSGSSATGAAGSCWEPRWSVTGRPRWPSGSTSSRRRCTRRCPSGTSSISTSATPRR